MSNTLGNQCPKRSVVIDNDIHQALGVQLEIVATVKRCHPGETELSCIRLALEEALVNAVMHGNQSDPNKKLHIEYEVGPSELRVRIEDEGPGFDPTSLPDPTRPEYRMRPRGRGVFLMRHGMTQVNFLGRGNCVEMIRHLNGANVSSVTTKNDPARQQIGTKKCQTET